ncbi:hypothetical protein Goshw_016989 [Gossypium schwendimanii]|uniref:Uncharacterized protein n=1 Tax=Gossypium schwendimanii TaxID=34291 RepID=A0A7J9MTZ8_GOSSC|nr:hypothetical protein [Gossypium schwendimanii]
MSIGVNCSPCFPRHRPNSPTIVSSSSSLSSIIVCSKIPVGVCQHLQFLSLHPSVLESLLIPVVFDYIGYCLMPCIILELALLLNLHLTLLVADMDTSAGPSLFPLHRCKTLHLVGIEFIFPFNAVRHAQGIHNVDGDKNYKAYMSPEYFDAHITPLGWQQVDNLRKHVHECGLAKRIDLVITSPLLR